MKVSTVAASAVFSLAPFAYAAPHMKRAPVCDLSVLSGLTLTAAGDPDSRIRWNVFQVPRAGIEHGTLAWFFESDPDDFSKFQAISSTNGPNIFTFQNNAVNQQVLATDSGFQGSSSGGTEFIVTCNDECNTGVPDHELAAAGCTMEITDGSGKGTGKCVSWPTGSTVPVEIADCDGSTSQQMGIFVAL